MHKHLLHLPMSDEGRSVATLVGHTFGFPFHLPLHFHFSCFHCYCSSYFHFPSHFFLLSFHLSVHFLSLPTSDISSKSQNKQSRSMVQLLSLHKVTLEEHIFNSNYIQGDFFNCPPSPKVPSTKKLI